jgi:hypothetical protein
MSTTLAGNSYVGYNGESTSNPYSAVAGGRRGLKAKTLKRMLKKAGLRTSGKKATLRARAKKAHLVRGGVVGLGIVGSTEQAAPVSGGRYRSRRRGRSYRY